MKALNLLSGPGGSEAIIARAKNVGVPPGRIARYHQWVSTSFAAEEPAVAEPQARNSGGIEVEDEEEQEEMEDEKEGDGNIGAAECRAHEQAYAHVAPPSSPHVQAMVLLRRLFPRQVRPCPKYMQLV